MNTNPPFRISHDFFVPSSFTSISLIRSFQTPWGCFGILRCLNELGELLAVYRGFINDQNLPNGAGSVFKRLAESRIELIELGYYEKGRWISPFIYSVRLRSKEMRTSLPSAIGCARACASNQSVSNNGWIDGYAMIKTPQICYKGFLQDGKKHGYGILYDLKFHCIYEGFWKNNRRHGYGKIEFLRPAANEEKFYQGGWKEDFRDGKGHIIYQNGSTFYGIFYRNDQIYGRLTSKEKQLAYLGYFRERLFHGPGTITYFDKFHTRFIGRFKKGRAVGEGLYEHTENGRTISTRVKWEESGNNRLQLLPNDD